MPKISEGEALSIPIKKNMVTKRFISYMAMPKHMRGVEYKEKKITLNLRSCLEYSSNAMLERLLTEILFPFAGFGWDRLITWN